MKIDWSKLSGLIDTTELKKVITAAVEQYVAAVIANHVTATPVASTDAAPVTVIPSIPVVNAGTERATPPGITQAYMDQNGSSEECSIEPRTGLMVRIAVWCYNDRRGVWGWWLLSSVGEMHIYRKGNNLVFDNYSKNGVDYTCRGFANYEPQYTEADPKLCATGSTCPYDGGRRYVIVDCWRSK